MWQRSIYRIPYGESKISHDKILLCSPGRLGTRLHPVAPCNTRRTRRIPWIDFVNKAGHGLPGHVHHDLALHIFVSRRGAESFDFVQHSLEFGRHFIHLALHQRRPSQRHARIRSQVEQRAPDLCCADPAWRRSKAGDVVGPATAQGAIHKDMADTGGGRGFVGHDAHLVGVENLFHAFRGAGQRHTRPPEQAPGKPPV